MSTEKVSGYVLDESFSSNSEAATFPGFPGVWRAGEPVAAESLLAGLGLEKASDLDALIKDLELPLKKAKADQPEAGVPGSSADLRATDPDLADRSLSPMPGLSAQDFHNRVAYERDRAASDPDFKPSPILARAAAGLPMDGLPGNVLKPVDETERGDS